MCNKIYLYLWKAANRKKEEEYRRRFQIHPSARLNYIENIWLKGNIYIGAYTYINSGRFTSGPDTRIVIGEWCAIAHNVSIMGWTHDLVESTGPEDQRPSVQKDVIIGDHVWIGTNAFIREGVNIGSNSIIGANSVVTNDVPANAVVGGIPARIIKYKVA